MVRVTAEILERMRVPRVHWGATLSKIPGRCTHRKIISDYLNNLEKNMQLGKGLLLFGDYSVGKSAIAAIILKSAVMVRKIGLWVVHRRLPEYHIEKTLFDGETTVWERIHSVPILVVDELLLRNDIAYTEQALEYVVRQRIDMRRATIITSNYAPSTIQSKYPSLESAMREAYLPVKVSGHNFREEIRCNGYVRGEVGECSGKK